MASKIIITLFFCLCLMLCQTSVAKSTPNQSDLDSGSSDIFIEAENGVRSGVSIQPKKGFSGEGYVSGFRIEGDKIEFAFNAEEDLYELIIGYSTLPGETKGYELWVNDEKIEGMFKATDGSFQEHNAGKYKLNSGQNKVIIGKGWGWFDIDYMKFNKTTVQLPLKPPMELSDKKASPATKSLLNFLVDCYGKKVLSGQQDMDKIEYVISVTGKSPAVGCFDLIDYSPSRLEFGAKPEGEAEKWIEWAKKNNGIVSLSWHWNAPAELINNEQENKAWWFGFYTRATNFDFEKALSDKRSQNYKLLLRDMDAIARELKKFQDADVPILWRPLHEADGGWFWWGAKGPEPFKELWNLMYTRFTYYHKLHNLIWVYTGVNKEWYPGDDLVDIVGLDIYAKPSSSMSSNWEEVQSRFNGKKLVALSESGTIPEPGKIRTYGTWWSWFSVWSGKFIHEVGEDTLKSVYNDEDIITLDELPDWRSYGITQKTSK